MIFTPFNQIDKYYCCLFSLGFTNINPKTPTPQSKPEPVLTTVDVYINNVKQYYNPSAYIKNGTTLVPMKAIFVSLSATVTYDDATKK